jgi:hypothetical protein
LSVAGGAYTWLPCEVEPGPFSDERWVRIASEFGDWVGYVPVSYALSCLKSVDPIEGGSYSSFPRGQGS